MKTSPRQSAFTLVEMLMVIAIVGILVAIAMPTVKGMRTADSTLAGTRQMLDDVGRARQYAISRRTTVYMVFCPSNFWNDTAFTSLSLAEKTNAAKLWDKQLSAYTFVTLRSVGDQPGRSSVNYLTSWRTLPEGAIIAGWKFASTNVTITVYDPPLPATPTDRTFNVSGFAVTNGIPFPSEAAAQYGPPYVSVPYIAFNHLGQLVSGADEYIPLARGSVSYSRDQDKKATQGLPTLFENPAGASTNAFMLVHIDWLTGRARLEKQEFK